jgi:hypothetical protein
MRCWWRTSRPPLTEVARAARLYLKSSGGSTLSSVPVGGWHDLPLREDKIPCWPALEVSTTRMRDGLAGLLSQAPEGADERTVQ